MNVTTVLGYEIDLGEPPNFVCLVFGVCIIGAFLTSVKPWIKVHYCLPMLLVGMIGGYVYKVYPTFSEMAGLSLIPGLNNAINHKLFLPVLVLHSAFTLDPCTFKSANFSKQIATGVLWFALSATAEGIFVFFATSFYPTDYQAANMAFASAVFGCMTSITGHMMLIGALNKLGTYRSLVQFLESIRMVSIMIVEPVIASYPHYQKAEHGWLFILTFIIGNLLIAPFIGWICVKIVLFCMAHAHNDVILEVSMAFSMCYIGVYIADWIPGILLAANIMIVTYAVMLNNHRDKFSVGAENFFQHFIEVLCYVIETLLYFISGFNITCQDFEKFEYPFEPFYIFLFLTFFYYSMFFKCLLACIVWPFAHRWHNLRSWQEIAALALCDYNSSFSLIYSLDMLDEDHVKQRYLSSHFSLQHLFISYVNLFIVSRIALGSLVLNLTLTGLGMKHMSLSRQVAMSRCVQKVRTEIGGQIKKCKTDRFLADADWDIVFTYVNFEDVYRSGNMFHNNSILDSTMSPEEEITVEEEARLQVLQDYKRSFQRQYEHGMLSLMGIRKLLEYCDIAERAGYIQDMRNAESIKEYCQFEGTSKLSEVLMRRFERHQKERLDILHQCSMSFATTPARRIFFNFCTNRITESVLIVAMLLSVIGALVMLVFVGLCNKRRNWVLTFFMEDLLNMVYMTLLTVHLIQKFIIMRLKYMKLFGSYGLVFLFVVGCADIAINYMYLNLYTQLTDYCSKPPSIKYILHFACVVHRILRLATLVQDKSNFFYGILIRHIQQKVRHGYELGKGFITCKDEVYNNVSDYVVDGQLANQIKEVMADSKTRLMQELGVLQKQNSRIIRSVKSYNAGRRILNLIEEAAFKLRKDGLLDETEAQLLDKMVKMRIKKLRNIPVMVPDPPIATILSQLKWIDGDERLLEIFVNQCMTVNMAEGETFEIDNGAYSGLFVIVTGLVEIELPLDESSTVHLSMRHTTKSLPLSSQRGVPAKPSMTTHDYVSTGYTFGEMSLLVSEPYPKKASCLTSIVLCHIPYDTVRSMLDLITDDPTLEYRLWILCASHVSLPLLKGLRTYQTLPLDEIKRIIDYGILDIQIFDLPPGTLEDDGKQVYNLVPYIDCDVVLVYGTAKYLDRNETFVGPCIVPLGVDYLVFKPIDGDMFVLYFVPQFAQMTSLAHSGSLSELTPTTQGSLFVDIHQSLAGSFIKPTRSFLASQLPAIAANAASPYPRRLSVPRPGTLPSIPDDQVVPGRDRALGSDEWVKLAADAMTSGSSGTGSVENLRKTTTATVHRRPQDETLLDSSNSEAEAETPETGLPEKPAKKHDEFRSEDSEPETAVDAINTLQPSPMNTPVAGSMPYAAKSPLLFHPADRDSPEARSLDALFKPAAVFMLEDRASAVDLHDRPDTDLIDMTRVRAPVPQSTRFDNSATPQNRSVVSRLSWKPSVDQVEQTAEYVSPDWPLSRVLIEVASPGPFLPSTVPSGMVSRGNVKPSDGLPRVEAIPAVPFPSRKPMNVVSHGMDPPNSDSLPPVEVVSPGLVPLTRPTTPGLAGGPRDVPVSVEEAPPKPLSTSSTADTASTSIPLSSSLFPKSASNYTDSLPASASRKSSRTPTSPYSTSSQWPSGTTGSPVSSNEAVAGSPSTSPRSYVSSTPASGPPVEENPDIDHNDGRPKTA